MKSQNQMDKKISLKKELYIKLIILIILILLIIITSFNTGRKLYVLRNTYIEASNGEVNSSVARWEFDAKIVLVNEEEYD